MHLLDTTRACAQRFLLHSQAAEETAAEGEPAGEEGEKKGGFLASIPNPCTALWGGPIQPTSDDNLWTYSERFFGGVTTAHGINRKHVQSWMARDVLALSFLPTPNQF